MKKLFTTLAIILTGTQLFAVIRTVNNNNPSPGQYSTVAAADAASLTDDTLYITGSATSYGYVIITKGLTLVGTGYNPQKQNPLISTFDDIIVQTGATVRLRGLYVSGGVRRMIGSGGSLNINRCRIDGTVRMDVDLASFGISSSVIGGTINCDRLGASLYLDNSIVYGQIEAHDFFSNFELEHNVFLYTGSHFVLVNNNNNGGAIIRNNIFYGATPNAGGTLVNSPNRGTFTYNVSYLNTFVDDDGNNIVADPLFVNVPTGTTTFNLAHDYSLQATSPALTNLGSDATQRGLFGGTFAPNIFHVHGQPAIPIIKSMSMPSTVLSGQSIQVNFSSKTNQ